MQQAMHPYAWKTANPHYRYSSFGTRVSFLNTRVQIAYLLCSGETEDKKDQKMNASVSDVKNKKIYVEQICRWYELVSDTGEVTQFLPYMEVRQRRVRQGCLYVP